jgi:L-lysine 6-transaminase
METSTRLKNVTNVQPSSMQEESSVHDRIGRYLLADVFPFVLDLERSRGNHIYDSRGKRFLLDGFSFIASNPLGYNHPGMNDEAFEEKLLRVAKIKPSNSDLYTEEMAGFVETFARIAMPKGAKHLFFVEGGTMAVENALKAAFDWKVRLNNKRGVIGERGTKILHFKEAFHGRSGYCLSLTNTDQRKTKFFPKFDWPRVTNPKLRFPLNFESLAEARKLEEQSISEILDAIKANPGDIAALILEPIQGEGGDNHFSVEFHQELRKICDEHEMLMIYDEVQSGIGLTGKMWAQEHYGVTPDITCFGKKTQVCGIAVGEKIESVENHVFEEASRINSTWGGNLVDMVRAQRYLEIIEDDRLVKNAEIVGGILLEELVALQTRHPEVFSNARGKGLMCGLDVVTPERRAAIIKGALENGAIILGSGARTLRLRPSLTFTADNVLELMRAIEKAVKA